MNKCLLSLICLTAAITITSCSAFHKLSKHNEFESDDMVLFYNRSLNVQSHTFGDFTFASNKQEYKKISDKKPLFNNILLYAKTIHPAYEYYILVNAKPVTNPNFVVRDKIIGNNKITIAISKDAPADDMSVIIGRLLETKRSSGNAAK